MNPANWSTVFDELEKTLVNIACTPSRKYEESDPARVELNRRLIKEDLNSAKHLRLNLNMDDAEFWGIVCSRPFYANRRSLEVDRAKPSIIKRLCDIEDLLSSEWDRPSGTKFREFLEDPHCRNEPDYLEQVVEAGRHIAKSLYFKRRDPLITMFLPPKRDYSKLEECWNVYTRFRKFLKYGPLMTLHIMTDLGLPVIKPDRVAVQVAIRLGILSEYRLKSGARKEIAPSATRDQCAKYGQDENFLRSCEERFFELSKETGRTQRELDLILVKLGQEAADDSFYMRQICSEKKPACDLCGAKPACRFATQAKSLSLK